MFLQTCSYGLSLRVCVVDLWLPWMSMWGVFCQGFVEVGLHGSLREGEDLRYRRLVIWVNSNVGGFVGIASVVHVLYWRFVS